MTEPFGAIAVGNRAPVTSHCRATADGLQRPSSTPCAISDAARSRRLAAGLSIAVLVTLAGCGAPAPKNYGGSWTPVNRFQSAPTEIPLAPAYTFYASPMDATLRTMLNRWASDNGLLLTYQIGSDFTLHQPVAKIRTSDIQSAIAELNAIYAPQGLSIAADGKQLLVQAAGAAAPTEPGPR